MTEPITADAEVTAGPLVLDGLEGLQARLGTDLGVSGWRDVTQADISSFGNVQKAGR